MFGFDERLFSSFMIYLHVFLRFVRFSPHFLGIGPISSFERRSFVSESGILMFSLFLCGLFSCVVLVLFFCVVFCRRKVLAQLYTWCSSTTVST